MRKLHRKAPESKFHFDKVLGLQLAALLKKRLRHRSFPINYDKFSRTYFFRTPTPSIRIIKSLPINVPNLYPLKTPEINRFASVFRGYKMGILARKKSTVAGPHVVFQQYWVLKSNFEFFHSSLLIWKWRESVLITAELVNFYFSEL